MVVFEILNIKCLNIKGCEGVVILWKEDRSLGQVTPTPSTHLVVVHLELEEIPEEKLDVSPVRVHYDVVDLLTLDLPQHLPKIKV